MSLMDFPSGIDGVDLSGCHGCHLFVGFIMNDKWNTTLLENSGVCNTYLDHALCLTIFISNVIIGLPSRKTSCPQKIGKHSARRAGGGRGGYCRENHHLVDEKNAFAGSKENETGIDDHRESI
ncbi:hypothetical protein HAX54_010671 [Datura stramonium]|uniref:Uncharacterized protein n=1 Tax=Datura stramonium TaxID=4076 RepID=A0ABS8TJD6_DATST|nr:hypothetical protein [Datura stramonium]